MNREPLVTVASITAIASALVGLLVAFGVPLNDTQTAAVLGVVGVVAPLVVGLVGRGKVTPVAPAHRGQAGASNVAVALMVVGVVLILADLLFAQVWFGVGLGVLLLGGGIVLAVLERR